MAAAPAKKPLPAMDPANFGKQPPFAPPVYRVTVGPPLPKGTYQEAGLYLKLYDYFYNGQGQVPTINFKWPKPV
jgi:hypothetical protein